MALQAAADALARAQEAADEAGARLSELTARRNAILRAIEEHTARVARLDRELAETSAKRNALMARYTVEGDGDKLSAAVEHARRAGRRNSSSRSAEAEAAGARRARRRSRQPQRP